VDLPVVAFHPTGTPAATAPGGASAAGPPGPESVRELDALCARIAADVHAGRLAIPPFPRVALELHKIARSVRPDLALACQLIEREAELAGRVVKAACAPVFGGRAVTRLQDAGMRLGTDGLRNVAMAASMGRVLRGRVAAIARDIMMHSFVVAVTAHKVCGLLGLPVHEGYMLGLFHDIGRAVIAVALDDYGQRAPALLDPGAMTRIADALHGRVGAIVVESWGLGELAQDVGGHHAAGAEDAAAARRPVHAVRVADAAERLAAASASERAALLAGSPAVVGLGLSPAQLTAIAEQIDVARADNVFHTFVT
jgi:HD-like signal output (HDOD) protein